MQRFKKNTQSLFFLFEASHRRGRKPRIARPSGAAFLSEGAALALINRAGISQALPAKSKQKPAPTQKNSGPGPGEQLRRGLFLPGPAALKDGSAPRGLGEDAWGRRIATKGRTKMKLRQTAAGPQAPRIMGSHPKSRALLRVPGPLTEGGA